MTKPYIVYIGSMELPDGKGLRMYNVFNVADQPNGTTLTENSVRALGFIMEE